MSGRHFAFKPQKNPPATVTAIRTSTVIMESLADARVHGIPVLLDPRSKRIADARGLWPFKRIFVGCRFFDLPRGEQRAVLMHEAKHCLAFHLEKRLLSIFGMMFIWLFDEARTVEFARKIACKQELEADRFAHEQGFGAELASFMERIDAPDTMFYPERVKRLEHLRGLA